MSHHEDADMWDPSDYPMTGTYHAKRAAAYLVDLALVFFPILLVFYYTDSDLGNAMNWFYILIITGLFTFVLKVVLEFGTGRSPGKWIFGLRIVTPDGELSLGQVFLRNILNIFVVVGPILDMLIGRAVSSDERLKYLDNQSFTLVIEDVPLEVEEPRVRTYRPPVRVEEPTSREKFKLDYRQVRVGHCPRCGAPYRVLPPDDPSFSGLWNHRCTWCNYLIREDERE
ncbi:hypothetical protein B6U90_03940 [Thermoplasmatales archaeon ex4484_6]|nr:MAG: hypothetical protein B6U90_03940 [Thermoplasmatales archaeon ex4484_6]RLF67953.1 MAG: hypothetical protein DRN57_05005 [Thermoplasmata archaeon]